MLFHHLTSFLINVIVELAVFFLLVGVLLCLDELVVAIIGCGFFISYICLSGAHTFLKMMEIFCLHSLNLLIWDFH